MTQSDQRTNKRKHYVGVFDERNDAELAARDLREQGFKDDQIGYAWRDEEGKTRTEGNKSGEMAASGAGTGVVLGGIIGAGAALLIPGVGPVVSGGLLASALAGAATGAVAGGVAGGVSGALVGLGIPEEEARYYDDQFKEGRTLMTVRADDRYNDASDIIRRRRGYDYETRSDRPTTRERIDQETETRR
ncbi:MAG TPA: hypothetical protein VJP45_06175 [Candidatus Limnocylindria bacterium]|nr:hypothetical protein [Candidatus Limnocylindria bacterium]